MTVIFQEFISRADLRTHPERLYLFGDNVERVGRGGQAKECRGEPNAVGVATKWFPDMGPLAFFSDIAFDRCVAVIDADLKRAFDHVEKDGTVVIPTAGLGTGLSELPERAPRVYSHLKERLAALAEARH